jgi:hypothetical protein
MKSSDIFFSTKSMMDDFGRVFYFKDKIFRAIHPNKKDYCMELINSDLFKELLYKNCIPQTKIADFGVNGYDLILEHEKLTETLQHEWSFTMLKDAALLVLQVNEICNKHGYELKDAHTLNVLFKGVRPVWIDIGSISPLKNFNQNQWTAFIEFVSSFIIPLLFWSEKNFYVARKLLESNFYRMDLLPSQHILDNELISLLRKNPMEYQLNLSRIKILTTEKENKEITKFINLINGFVKTITFGIKSKIFYYKVLYFTFDGIKRLINETCVPEIPSSWQNYHQHYYNENGILKSSIRFEKIVGLIQKISIEIRSVIDLAGNEGKLCMMIAENINLQRIILTDYDANAIDSAYITFKKKNISNIQPLLLNFMFTPDIIGTAKRIKSDLVLALAITHHLILTNGFSIESVFERIKSYANKFVMIEFMPLGLWQYGSTSYPELPAWYNEEWFTNNFEKYFTLIKKERLEENRILFFGKINS